VLNTLEDLRADVPVLRHKVYLNTGTMGAAPQTVTVRFFKSYEQWQVEGAGWPEAYERRREGMARLRRSASLLLGVPEASLAFAGNVTQAVNLVAQGLAWQDGDEVIVGGDEHPANRYPWRALEAMGRIRVVPWPMAADDEELLADLRRLIGPRTRLVAVSQVLQTSGRILPAAEITAICRSEGVLSLVDGAQAVGQVEVDLAAMDPDFYPFSGHKWLLGPVGTSGVYIRPGNLERIGLLPAGSGSAEHDLAGRLDREVPWRATARRYEVGTANWPLFEGLEAALALRAGIGARQIEAHQRSLAEAFVAGLPQGVELIGVPRRAAMCTVRLPAGPPDALTRLAAEHRVIARGVGELDPPGLRFSFGPYNNLADVAAAHEALAALVARA
jgi:selenocysteine lyase/cysteine desulfurase